MLVISVVGKTCSGKNYFASYARRKYGFVIVDLGDLLREGARARGLALNQENLRRVQEEIGFQTGLVKLAIKKIRDNKWDKICIVGNRQLPASKILRAEFASFRSVFVDAAARVRFERMLERGRANDPKTFGEFLDYDKTEEEVLHPSAAEVYSLADFRVENSASLRELEKKIDEVIGGVVE